MLYFSFQVQLAIVSNKNYVRSFRYLWPTIFNQSYILYVFVIPPSDKLWYDSCIYKPKVIGHSQRIFKRRFEVIPIPLSTKFLVSAIVLIPISVIPDQVIPFSHYVSETMHSNPKYWDRLRIKSLFFASFDIRFLPFQQTTHALCFIQYQTLNLYIFCKKHKRLFSTRNSCVENFSR